MSVEGPQHLSQSLAALRARGFDTQTAEGHSSEPDVITHDEPLINLDFSRNTQDSQVPRPRTRPRWRRLATWGVLATALLAPTARVVYDAGQRSAGSSVSDLQEQLRDSEERNRINKGIIDAITANPPGYKPPPVPKRPGVSPANS